MQSQWQDDMQEAMSCRLAGCLGRVRGQLRASWAGQSQHRVLDAGSFLSFLQAALVEYMDSCEVRGLATPPSMHTRLVELMLELGGEHQVTMRRTCRCHHALMGALCSRNAEPALVGKSSGVSDGWWPALCWPAVSHSQSNGAAERRVLTQACSTRQWLAVACA